MLLIDRLVKDFGLVLRGLVVYHVPGVPGTVCSGGGRSSLGGVGGAGIELRGDCQRARGEENDRTVRLHVAAGRGARSWVTSGSIPTQTMDSFESPP